MDFQEPPPRYRRRHKARLLGGRRRYPVHRSSRLRRLATFLRESGIEIIFHEQKGTGGRRLLTVTRKVLDLTASTATTAPAEPARLSDQSVKTDS